MLHTHNIFFSLINRSNSLFIRNSTLINLVLHQWKLHKNLDRMFFENRKNLNLIKLHKFELIINVYLI